MTIRHLDTGSLPGYAIEELQAAGAVLEVSDTGAVTALRGPGDLLRDFPPEVIQAIAGQGPGLYDCTPPPPPEPEPGMTRARFEALSPAERMEYIRAGGVLTDD